MNGSDLHHDSDLDPAGISPAWKALGNQPPPQDDSMTDDKSFDEDEPTMFGTRNHDVFIRRIRVHLLMSQGGTPEAILRVINGHEWKRHLARGGKPSEFKSLGIATIRADIAAVQRELNAPAELMRPEDDPDQNEADALIEIRDLFRDTIHRVNTILVSSREQRTFVRYMTEARGHAFNALLTHGPRDKEDA